MIISGIFMSRKDEYKKPESKKEKKKINYIIMLYFSHNKYEKNLSRVFEQLELCLKSKNKNYEIKRFDNINSFYTSLQESELENFVKNLDDCIKKFTNLEYKIEKEAIFKSYED